MARLRFPAAFGAMNAAMLYCMAAFLFSGCVTDQAPSVLRAKNDVGHRQSAPELTLPDPIHALAWNYADDTNIVFNVYSTTNLAEPFRWRETVTEKIFYFVADQPMEFFEVTASNILDGTESLPATR